MHAEKTVNPTEVSRIYTFRTTRDGKQTTSNQTNDPLMVDQWMENVAEGDEVEVYVHEFKCCRWYPKESVSRGTALQLWRQYRESCNARPF